MYSFVAHCRITTEQVIHKVVILIIGGDKSTGDPSVLVDPSMVLKIFDLGQT